MTLPEKFTLGAGQKGHAATIWRCCAAAAAAAAAAAVLLLLLLLLLLLCCCCAAAAVAAAAAAAACHSRVTFAAFRPLSRRPMVKSSYACRLISGLVAILLAVATWEAMAKLIAGLHLSAERPLLCVYCTHSGYAIFLFVPCGRRIAAKLGWRVQRRMPAEDAPHRRAPAAGGLLSRRMLGGSFLLALFWTASAYLWFVSLHLTLVSVNNCLFQSSAVFVFALSVPLLKERVTLLKAGAVVASIVGIALVIAFSPTSRGGSGPSGAVGHLYRAFDGSGEPVAADTVVDTWQGYLLLGGSVLLFAAYEVGIKVTLQGDGAHSHGAVDDSLGLLGLVGVWTTLLFWPGVLMEAAFGSSPPVGGLLDAVVTWDQLRLLLLSTAMDAVINASLFASRALVSPLFLIPVGIVVDSVTLGVQWHAGAYCGTAGIVLGFVALAVATTRELRAAAAGVRKEGDKEEDKEDGKEGSKESGSRSSRSLGALNNST